MALLTKRQIRAFKRHKTGYYSLWILGFFVLLSMGAELVANSNPLYMRFRGKSYFPVFQTITNERLGLKSAFLQVNYHSLRKEHPEATFIMPLIPWHPNESDRSLDKIPSGPSHAHWMGTDDRGRDIASRLLYGLRNSLVFAVSVWLISYFVGIAIGAVQGFSGGWIDFGFQRVIEVISSIPTLFILIILVSMVQPGIGLLIVFTSVFAWISISYYVRAEFLKLRKLDFVEAARSQGLSRVRVIWRHLIPNAMTPVITFTPFALTANIVGLAGLDYLGFGLAPPAASWGEMLNQALRHFDHAWWLAVFPSLALVGTLLVLNFIGEGLREALDPHSGS
jgi:microcin C transport system permease protein